MAIRAAQQLWESRATALLREGEAAFLNGTASMADISGSCCAHAVTTVAAWWELSDELLRDFAYPSAASPAWWLQSTNYVDGPPPSPDVPPPPTRYPSV